jgi:hypothetical protein
VLSEVVLPPRTRGALHRDEAAEELDRHGIIACRVHMIGSSEHPNQRNTAKLSLGHAMQPLRDKRERRIQDFIVPSGTPNRPASSP